ncbi:MAG: Aspartate aminotransferase [Chitinophagaceae bacterium]|nr:Aspartate aminotransferase [Chitinophagaceae bacterium]
MNIKYSFVLLLAFVQLTVMAQTKGPGIEFKEVYFDFGDIKQGAVVEHVFQFTNTGDSTLLIQKAYSSCGCTIPSFPKEGIAPGQSGQITVKFNSEGKMGLNNKIITILTNTKTEVPGRLSIKVNVLPK